MRGLGSAQGLRVHGHYRGRRCREARLGEVAMKRCLRAGKDDSYYHVLAGLHGHMVARARCQLQLTGASHPTGRLGYQHRTVQRAPWPCCHLTEMQTIL